MYPAVVGQTEKASYASVLVVVIEFAVGKKLHRVVGVVTLALVNAKSNQTRRRAEVFPWPLSKSK
jgi:hypothetical protein